MFDRCIQGVEDDQETQLDAAFATVCSPPLLCMLHVCDRVTVYFVAKRVPKK